MRSLLEITSARDNSVNYADWAETCTLFKRDRTVSQEDLAREIHRSGLATEGRARVLASEAFDEITDRIRSIGNGISPLTCYPFRLTSGGDVVQLTHLPRGRSRRGLIYLFLLTITRASMHARDRVLASVDPTRTFERLCANALLGFWGGHGLRTSHFVLGTSRTPQKNQSFKQRVDELCRHLSEGEGWRPKATSPGAGDGGFDVVVWTGFLDRRSGGLVGFAQCKTGDHWRDDISKHTPRSFSQRYFRQPLTIDPLKVYMVPCRIAASRWSDHTKECGGLLFDRCRIVTCADTCDAAVISECKTWFEEAMSFHSARIGGAPSMRRRTKKSRHR